MAAVDRVGTRDVDADADRDVGVAELGGDGLGGILVEVGDDHARAVGGEALGDRLADARTRHR